MSAEVQKHFSNHFFEGAPLSLTFISHIVFHIILVCVIFSGFITVLNSFTGIPVLSFKHLLVTTNKSGTYSDLVGCWILQDETSLFPFMGCGFQNTNYGNCLPLPPAVHHLQSSLTASAFSTQTVSAYCCLCLHFLLWEEESLQIPSELLHLQWLQEVLSNLKWHRRTARGQVWKIKFEIRIHAWHHIFYWILVFTLFFLLIFSFCLILSS